MRCIVALLAIFFARAALAEEDMSGRLFGSWHLISLQLKVVGEGAEPKDIFGPNPIGRIIFSPEHRVVVFISRAGRRPPTSESEAAALLSSMTAYTGKFRLDGDKFITQVDGAWNEFYKGSEQVRYFELTGDKLSIRTPAQQSGILIGKRTVATLMWEREVPCGSNLTLGTGDQPTQTISREGHLVRSVRLC